MVNKIRDFLEGNLHYYHPKDAHVTEQAIYRSILCKPCLLNGSCYHCKCKTPNMFFAPKKRDSLNKWGPMLDKESWSTLKRTLPRKILDEIEEGRIQDTLPEDQGTGREAA